jgi:PAS domain S-box-containing protein
MPHIVWTHDGNGVVTYFNRRWVEYTGMDLAETLQVGATSVVHPDDLPELVRLFAESASRGAPIETSYRLKRKQDGCFRWHRGRVVPLERASDSVILWAGTAMDEHDQRRADEEQKFLVHAGRVLGTSLDLATTLGDVARLAVPNLADWCAIDLRSAAGRLERQAVAHADPAKVELAWELWRRSPPQPDDPVGAYAVLRTGRPELLADIDDALLERVVQDPELLKVLRSLGLRSSICVPLTGREGTLGTLTLVTAESRERFDQRRMEFAVDFAHRIAVAVENARLYAAENRARAAAEALAADVIEQSRNAEAAVLTMRQERDAALARLEAAEAKARYPSGEP